MRVSISFTRHGWPGGPTAIRAGLTDAVSAAEDAGLDTVWIADHLEDTVELALRMWSGDDSSFEGRRNRAAAPLGSPRPIHRPPIMIGGTGERRTLPLVARHGDAGNVFDIPDGGATVRHKLDVLRRLCDEAARPYAEIEKTISTRWLPGTPPAEFARRCAEFAGWGLDHVVLITPAPWTPATLTELATALPT
jgi:alkanesulfonate monooxygenase SsuD/methylene tetrahydromethanopterin reductase-like flavin-dependent oxidoreductase (luciferase family)